MTRVSYQDDSVMHFRLNSQQNTDPAAISKFKRTHNWHICEARNMGMTAKACREMRQRALIAKKIVSSSSKCMQYVGDVYLKLAPCVKCKDYAGQNRGNR